ncbi:MAG TPA: LamG-like jellyroll fold domain-containing protein [Flavobacterium sp.]|nr:LamG-like jellyroll fold domain-containing protein [Flavobacterium sp.]
MIKKLLLLLFVITFNSYSQNNYLDFDGLDDNVNVPNSDNLVANATAISMSCKVYPKRVSFGFPDFNGIMGYRNESNFDFYLIQLSSTDVEARFRNAAGEAYTITYTGLVLNQWTQFFLVYNGSTLKLYNGTAEVGSVAASGSAPASSSGSLKIGLVQYQAFNWYHSGYIDEASLWNKALSPTDISNIVANNGEIINPGGETNLKAYYKFNQGVAYGNNTGLTTLTDAMGLTNGTLANFGLNGQASNWGSNILDVSHFGQNAIQVYPNPASDQIAVSGLVSGADITILDTTGRIVSREKLSGESTIDVSNLTSGVYFLGINDNQKIRFIKN